MPRVALIVALAGVLLGATADRAAAHLVPAGADTLLGMMAAADGMVVARSAAETYVRDGKSAATPFLSREVVAGTGPENEFLLDADPPVLRYAELQDALVLLVRRTTPSGRALWVSVQPAGAGITLESATLPEHSREVLRRLWGIAHPATPRRRGSDRATRRWRGVTRSADVVPVTRPRAPHARRGCHPG